MLKQKKLKTILILIIKISFSVKNNYVLYKKIEFMSTNSINYSFMSTIIVKK